MGQQTLVGNEYFRLTRDEEACVARLVRTTLPFASLEALRAAAQEVERAASQLPPGCHLLVDTREAPARNDPDFEEQFVHARRDLMAHFARVAVLVKSAVGVLQASRYAREDGRTGQRVFDDEGAALAFLEAL